MLVIVQLPLRCCKRLLKESDMRWSIASALCAVGVEIVMICGGYGVYLVNQGENQMYFTMAASIVVFPMIFTLDNFLFLWLKRDFHFFKQRTEKTEKKESTPQAAGAGDDDEEESLEGGTRPISANLVGSPSDDDVARLKLIKAQAKKQRNKEHFLGNFRSQIEKRLKTEAYDLDEDFR
jgi:hypothetical protein